MRLPNPLRPGGDNGNGAYCGTLNLWLGRFGGYESHRRAGIVVKAGEGRSVSLGGMVVFKVSAANTGGAFALVEHPMERLDPRWTRELCDEAARADAYVLECGPRPGPTLGGDCPGGFRDLLHRTRGGGRSWSEAGAGGQVRGDLFIGLGRPTNLQVQLRLLDS